MFEFFTIRNAVISPAGRDDRDKNLVDIHDAVIPPAISWDENLARLERIRNPQKSSSDLATARETRSFNFLPATPTLRTRGNDADIGVKAGIIRSKAARSRPRRTIPRPLNALQSACLSAVSLGRARAPTFPLAQLV